MTLRILLAGLDRICAENIINRWPPPRFKVVQLRDWRNLHHQVDLQSPSLVVIGSCGTYLEEGLRLVRNIKFFHKHLPIILISQMSCEARATEAFRAGVDDYFSYPITYDRLLTRMGQLIQQCACKEGGPSQLLSGRMPGMIGESKTMTDICARLMRIAQTESTVLLTGETGTGKDLAAEMIHHHSPRAKKPFVCINCAALPENLIETELFGHRKGAFTGAVADRKGAFEFAAAGTLFLDEISEMSSFCQAKILRCFEHKKIYPLGSHSPIPTDVRIVAATNKDLETMVHEGKFRADLYYRLNVARVQLPPLRERKEDIPQLISMAINRFNSQFNSQVQGLSEEAMTALMMHSWPGNIRELNNTLESAFIDCRSSKIEFVDLPPVFTKALNFVDPAAIHERDKLLTVLTCVNWNKTAAAKKLKWSRMRVYRALRRYNLFESPPSTLS